ncbi:MAG: hypothetical protein P4L61_02900 [Candidatus Pacebacteria bacterium]|nr:hypothetical protein [Candidatus Paceibacterota bacterium]
MNAKEFLLELGKRCPDNSASQAFAYMVAGAINDSAMLSTESQQSFVRGCLNEAVHDSTMNIDSLKSVLPLAAYINTCR